MNRINELLSTTEGPLFQIRTIYWSCPGFFMKLNQKRITAFIENSHKLSFFFASRNKKKLMEEKQEASGHENSEEEVKRNEEKKERESKNTSKLQRIQMSRYNEDDFPETPFPVFRDWYLRARNSGMSWAHNMVLCTVDEHLQPHARQRFWNVFSPPK